MEKEQKNSDFAYILIYSFTWLTGIIFFFVSKDDKKQHSIQAIVLGVIMIVIALIPYIGLLDILIWLYGLYIGYRASINSDAAIPYITDFAKKYA